MILSRVWYVLLGLAVAVALYVVYIAVGQYARQGTHALKEGLASDSQTVEWALKIDARRRLDALLAGSVDSALQSALVEANGPKDGKVPQSARDKAKKALASVNDAIPADWRDDALFAVDRDGQVVASLGYDAVNGNDEFELGGYPAVNDALHGWLRDDVWLLGSKMYVVVARPVEFDATQRPAGAIVGLKEVNQRFATDLAKRTRTAVAFYAAGSRVAAGVGVEGFDVEKLDAVGADLAKIDDKTYGEGGRSEVRMLTDDLGAMYARLPGDVWTMGGGFAVARAKTPLAGPMGFLSNADDKDKANVPWILLAAIVVLSALIGVAMTIFEHTLPLRELVMQAERLKVGVMDGLQVARFRGAYRLAAQNLNLGMERSIEKAGGVTRKPADLESIIGPVPAQPAMSAFSFPMADGGSSPMMQPPMAPPSAPGPAPFVPPPASSPGPPHARNTPAMGMAPVGGVAPAFPGAAPAPPPP
ncbi:MAG: MXAN_5187 family protein, partial [Polyangiaceae bacterium]